MIRRVLSGFVTMLAVLALSAPLYAAETITHQGRLLGADDQPVADGFHSALFSLWDDPVAGSQVWSEFRDFSTKSGLFSVELGQVSSFFDIFTEFADRDLYLQVQVQSGGSLETLSPRLRIGSAPFASTSKRVHAIHAGPNRASSCLVIATDSGAVAYLDDDSDDDGVADGFVDLSSSNGQSQFSVARKRPGRTKYSNVTLRTVEGGVSMDQDCDSNDDDLIDSRLSSSLGGGGGAGGSLVLAADLDGDGAMDRSVSSSCDATSAKHAINTKGTGGTRVASVASSTSELGASSVCSLDLDGDGVLDRRVDEDCDDVSASRSMSFFDVFTEVSLQDVCDATGARRRLDVTNLGSSGQDGVEIAARPGIGSGLRCVTDSDGDGVPEGVASLGLTPTTSSMAINRKGTGASNARVVSVSSSVDESSAVQRCDIDDDGDMVPEQEIEQSLTPTTSSVAIKTKGTGADPNRVILAGTTSLQGSSLACAQDVDGDGTNDAEVMLRESPTQCGVAIKTKGTGADANRSSVSSSSSPSSSSIVCDQDSDGDGVAESSISQVCDASQALVMYLSKKGYQYYRSNSDLAGRMTIATIANDTTIDVHGEGRIGIGKPADATRRIDVAGGAYCDGTNWVNASDVNSKENFENVDGEDILDKISGLEITKWNYKGDSETEHIGPTAQDFKETFGVGSDGKSISTIDPSGIALAAIKQLNKKNAELEAQVAELKKMVEELARKK